MSRLIKVSIIFILALSIVLTFGAAHAAGFSVSTIVETVSAAPGDLVTVSFTFTAGDTAIRGVQVLLSLPEGLLFNSATAPDGWIDYASGPSILAIGTNNLEPGASVTFKVLFTVNEEAAGIQKIITSNVAAASVMASLEQVNSLTGSLSGTDESGGIDIVVKGTIEPTPIPTFKPTPEPTPAPTPDPSAEPTVTPELPGDANGDDSIDILDLVSIIDFIVSGSALGAPTNADANGDGTVDILDLVRIIDQIVGSS